MRILRRRATPVFQAQEVLQRLLMLVALSHSMGEEKARLLAKRLGHQLGVQILGHPLHLAVHNLKDLAVGVVV